MSEQQTETEKKKRTRRAKLSALDHQIVARDVQAKEVEFIRAKRIAAEELVNALKAEEAAAEEEYDALAKDVERKQQAKTATASEPTDG